MMDKELKPKKTAVHVDRVNLSAKAVEKLKSWSEQVNPLLRGTRISFTALANWFLESQNDTLSTTQKDDICKSLHDEVRFARWALQELEAAKRRGENLSLAELLSKERPLPKATPRLKRNSKTKNDGKIGTDGNGDTAVKVLDAGGSDVPR